jgi:hypothetical protein
MDRLVDYETDDEDMAEELSPLRTGASFIEPPRNEEATTEDTRESQITAIVNYSVAEMESPSDTSLKVRVLHWVIANYSLI